MKNLFISFIYIDYNQNKYYKNVVIQIDYVLDLNALPSIEKILYKKISIAKEIIILNMFFLEN